ncbi:M50 family metallopeptidase [Cohnella cholangitidis]|uniref:Zn-dependent protease n=1 Tax=Cohnella cholangitidis TaxID=2598458 RepID=A0A7G5C3M9_9BACL|nr:M50 family metallopeptidase [Cohnella cholangitidis]QMV43813.1 Zn-dependent protease [Cohnella cholangitidis]
MIKWRGIQFRLHPLFVLVMIASVATGRFAELAMLFVIVLWHELGHLLAALRFGWTVKEVKLLPFGGVVEVEEAGTLPAREEGWVAIAGPAQNVILAAIGYFLGHVGWIDRGWSDDFVRANALIGLFNLLPVLPLDGGRILQAWICLQVPYHRTLMWSAKISLAFSGLIVVASIYPLWNGGLLHLNLLAVGLFLCVSNWMYYRNVPFVFLRFLVHRSERAEKHIDRGKLSQPIVIAENRPLSTIIRLFMKEQYHLIYVMKRGKIAKVVPEKAIIDGFLGHLTSGNADMKFFR